MTDAATPSIACAATARLWLAPRLALDSKFEFGDSLPTFLPSIPEWMTHPQRVAKDFTLAKTTSESVPVQSFQFPEFGNDPIGNDPARLRIEYGRLEVPRDEVERWRIGDTIEIPVRHEAPVGLTLGGRLVARGELVERNGKLGIRIVEVVETPDQPAMNSQTRKLA